MTTDNTKFFINKFPVQIQKRLDKGMGCFSIMGKGWLSIILDVDQKLSNINLDYKID